MSSGPKKITRDHYLFREGDAPDAMYVVKSGKLAVVKSKQTSEIILAEIGPGAMVGEMAFFDNKPRSASVKAMKDSEVIALPYKALHAQFQNFPEWCKAIMRTVNNHLRNANQRIKELEKNDNSEDLFPPHTINKLVAILTLVAHKFGKYSEEDKGVVLGGNLLRNYTIQIFQEATHKMQKMMGVLSELQYIKLEDLGEGRQKIVIYKMDDLFTFVDWHNEFLFKQEKDRVIIKEEEIKILNCIVHFAKKLPKNDKGLVKLNLSEMQNESMREVGYLVKTEETLGLCEKKLIGDQTMGDAGILFTDVPVDELDRIVPFWKFIYAMAKVRR
jgi:CRP/FNR family cyclic AMP-dependent transcriptional regulator